MTDSETPCPQCPWVSKAQRDIDAIEPMKPYCLEGMEFMCHTLSRPTCMGAKKFKEENTPNVT